MAKWEFGQVMGGGKKGSSLASAADQMIGQQLGHRAGRAALARFDLAACYRRAAYARRQFLTRQAQHAPILPDELPE